jgi:hypothetical protein
MHFANSTKNYWKSYENKVLDLSFYDYTGTGDITLGCKDEIQIQNNQGDMFKLGYR